MVLYSGQISSSWLDVKKAISDTTRVCNFIQHYNLERVTPELIDCLRMYIQVSSKYLKDVCPAAIDIHNWISTLIETYWCLNDC